MRNKLILGAAAIVLSLSMASLAQAYQGNPTVIGPNCTSEQHTAIQNAIEAGDYNAWKNLTQNKGGLTGAITQENFSKFIQMHQFIKEGKYAEADAIRQELGIGNRNGLWKIRTTGIGRGYGMMR